jgi:hypothetical protein
MSCFQPPTNSSIIFHWTSIKKWVSITGLLKSFIKIKMQDNFLTDVPSGLVDRNRESKSISCLKFLLLSLCEIPPCFSRKFCVNCVFTNTKLHLRPQLNRPNKPNAHNARRWPSGRQGTTNGIPTSLRTHRKWLHRSALRQILEQYR